MKTITRLATGLMLAGAMSVQADSGSMMKKMGDAMHSAMDKAADQVSQGMDKMMDAVRIGDIEVSHAFAREMIPGRDNSAAFMQLKNYGSQNIDLIRAESPEAFGRVELHTHIKDGEVMRMVEVEKIEVPAGGTTELKPGGLHVMLLDAKRVIKEGDSVSVTLHFSDDSSETVTMPVKRIMMKMKHKMAH